MDVDRDELEKYSPEYDVQVRRLTGFLALTSKQKEAMGAAISRFAPGETIRGHVNKSMVEEVFLLMDGKAEFTLDDEVAELHPGDIAFARIGQHHSIRNISTVPARLLSIWWKVVIE